VAAFLLHFNDIFKGLVDRHRDLLGLEYFKNTHVA
jgi:hypothetical protein